MSVTTYGSPLYRVALCSSVRLKRTYGPLIPLIPNPDCQIRKLEKSPYFIHFFFKINFLAFAFIDSILVKERQESGREKGRDMQQRSSWMGLEHVTHRQAGAYYVACARTTRPARHRRLESQSVFYTYTIKQWFSTLFHTKSNQGPFIHYSAFEPQTFIDYILPLRPKTK